MFRVEGFAFLNMCARSRVFGFLSLGFPGSGVEFADVLVWRLWTASCQRKKHAKARTFHGVSTTDNMF